MNKFLAAVSPYDWEQTDPRHLFEKLVQHALELKLLSQEQMENIRLQLLNQLSDQVKKYTRGESSSVPNEIAEKLAEGILYTIGFYFKGLCNTELMIGELKDLPLSVIFFKGQKKIKEQVDLSFKRLKTLQKTAQDFDNIAYRDTIQNGLDSFFTNYNIMYFPHESNGSIDYPLNIDKMDRTDITYFDSYIRKLQLENGFCGYFKEEDIQALLIDFNENSAHYLVNIFHLVLLNSIASVLLNRCPFCLELSKQDCDEIQIQLAGYSEEQLQKIIVKAVSQIAEELNLELSLKQYCDESALGVVAELCHSVRGHTLEHFFIVVKERTAPLAFIDRQPMDDRLFRELAGEIQCCAHINDKLSIFRKEIHSFEDLIGILDAECFFREEYRTVFSGMGEWELALLGANCLQSTGGLDIMADDKDWQTQYKQYLVSLDAVARQKIVGTAGRFYNQNNF